jgi:hypothetical protein
VIAIALATAGVFAKRKSRRISGGGSSAAGVNKMTRGRNKSPQTLFRTTSGSNVQDPITGETVGVPQIGQLGIQRTTAEIMAAQAVAPPSRRPPLKPEHEIEWRDDRPQNPNALPVASWPEPVAGATHPSGNVVVSAADLSPLAPQTVAKKVDRDRQALYRLDTMKVSSSRVVQKSKQLGAIL